MHVGKNASPQSNIKNSGLNREGFLLSPFICANWIYVLLCWNCNFRNKSWEISASDLKSGIGYERWLNMQEGREQHFLSSTKCLNSVKLRKIGGISSPGTSLTWTSNCGLTVHWGAPVDVPLKQGHTLGGKWELQDTWVHCFGTHHGNLNELCLLLICHCQLLEIVIPWKKMDVSKLGGYFLYQVRYLPLFVTLQTTVFKRMTWGLQSK